MKQIIIIIALAGIIFACSVEHSKFTNIIEHQIGKPFVLPNSVDFGSKGCIVNYVDSSDCTACRLKISQWKLFLSEINELCNDSVTLVFAVHPSIPKQIVSTLFKRENFSPIFLIDSANQIKTLNELGKDIRMHTFLLNAHGETIVIGNPVINPKIKKLYLDEIKKLLSPTEDIDETKN
ncbi:MAG: hypothetical protein HDS02_00765 [Bacteroides sp.]|nr:hypothetical protein [Bacteroides sp.]